jgi:uncharacterized metal-binding protein
MKPQSDNHSNPTLILSCSGASDVGELADRAARRMKRMGLGKMFCLAAVGGRVQQYIDDTKAAKQVIIIDGCENACAKKTLKTIDVQGHEFNLGTIGFQKGDSPATGKNIDKIVTHVHTKLSTQKS